MQLFLDWTGWLPPEQRRQRFKRLVATLREYSGTLITTSKGERLQITARFIVDFVDIRQRIRDGLGGTQAAIAPYARKSLTQEEKMMLRPRSDKLFNDRVRGIWLFYRDGETGKQRVARQKAESAVALTAWLEQWFPGQYHVLGESISTRPFFDEQHQPIYTSADGAMHVTPNTENGRKSWLEGLLVNKYTVCFKCY
jgi:hypothetical protein